MNDLHTLLVGYNDPNAIYIGPFPLGKTGLCVRLRYIAVLEAAYRSLGRSQSFGLGCRHFFMTYQTQMECMRHLWQSEIMRVMDKPRFGKDENLTVQLFHEKFQDEPAISETDKTEEQRFYDLLMDRYTNDGYPTFRNKAGFHIDKSHALKEPKPGGNLHDLTKLILDWFRHAGTVVASDEIRVVTRGGPQDGRRMASEFREMMLSTLRLRQLHRRRLAAVHGDGR